ncbi:MAG: T9SS type A sorting domain-containing protein, partial [Candidatus Cloacimonetes bacterium]|nr:T9SS type A sorting domain-containing protein [Candidatus Cloacimonadota bacterium]
RNSVLWDGRDDSNSVVSSGIYYYKITSGEFSETKKMILLK